MAYDAARGEVVLFGGYRRGVGVLNDTWTWDGTDWTQRSPLRSPPPRSDEGMAYDAANGQVVIFSGFGRRVLNDTWTWDGTDWTQQHPTHSPAFRYYMGMAYDAASGQVVLFGGTPRAGDTWTWDGTDWTQASPTHSPGVRDSMGMAYDAAAGQVVLFGGGHKHYLGDTWTWDGTDWTQRPAGSIGLSVPSGPPGSVVTVGGWGFLGYERVRVAFVDSVGGNTLLVRVTADATGAFTKPVTIPAGATPGLQHLQAKGVTSGQIAKRRFTVT